MSAYAIPGLKYKSPLTRNYQESIDKVVEMYNVPIEILKSPTRKRDVVLPRHVAMCALYVLHRWSFKKVGNYFNRDHTTVIHAVQMIKDLSQTDEIIRNDVDHMFPSLISILDGKKDYSPRRWKYVK